MAGDIVEKQGIHKIATQVSEKCGGLPLLIVTVARSLKDSPLYEWKDALRRLKKFDGKGLEEKTYSAIEWSYNKLDIELKSVFLLCASEVGSSNSVHILDLLKYGMGLGFIKNVETIEEARDALHSLLKKLQYSCLLQDFETCPKKHSMVRIHDLVKHVAQNIAARDHHVLSVSHGSELKEWSDKEFCEKCTKISIRDCNTPELPEVLQCPKLTMFLLSSVDDYSSPEIPSNFFQEMKKLKVLDLTGRSMASLPPSLKCLKDLHTLCLDQCILGDLALVGELQNLQILSFGNSKFKELPEEIGQLTRLQLLDLSGCSELQVIAPDVISKLIRLEELLMGNNGFNKWEAGRVGDTKRSNASLEELKCWLTSLQVHVPDANKLPADLFTNCELQRFQICIGSAWKWEDVDEALNALKLQLTTNNELDHSLKRLLNKTHDLYVEGMEGVNDKFFRELTTGGYDQLKYLHIQNNAKFAYTINEKVGFPNLTWQAVSELNSIRFLLSSSMARSLSKLKRLQISGCQIMKEVIFVEESNKEIVEDNFLCQLQDLELRGLPNLTSFCSTSYVQNLPNSSCEDCTKVGGICEEVEGVDSKGNNEIMMQHFLFENQVEFPNLKKLSIDGLAKLTNIWSNQLSPGNSNNIETIEIYSCSNLKSVFPASVAKGLQQLRSLIVQNCGVEEIVSREDDVQTTPMFDFPKLTYVRFVNLRQLKSFYPGLHSSKWPSLSTLLVYGCTKVQIFAKEIRETKNPCTLDEQSLFLLEKESFPNLENLGLDIMDNWGSPPLHYFRKLNTLSSSAHTNSSLSSLEKLLGLEKVNEETILHVSGDETLPLLRDLHFHGMPKLMDLGDDSFRPTKLYFPNVEVLVLVDCDSLKSLRSSAISFTNLKTLKVSRCKGLTYLISFSVAKSLMQLTTLEVRDCEEVIEIVACSGNDDSGNEIEFKLLKHLELSDLPRLRGFCSETGLVKFSSLEKLSITSCAQLEGFMFDPKCKSALGNHIQDTTSNGNIETEEVVPQFLFDNKVEFPRLTSLTLKGLTKLSAIWHNQLSHNSFNRLKDLELHGCGNLTSIFVTSTMGILKTLETLSINDCKSVKFVFELGRSDAVEEQKGIVVAQWALSDCESLNSVDIDSCNSLRSIFPLSVARNLQQLRSLRVWNCGVEEIISQVDDGFTGPTFVFPKVSYVRFQNLPELKSFYPGLHHCRWPSLRALEVYGCNEVRIFEDGMRALRNHYTPDKQSLFLIEKDSFPKLEILGLDVMENWDSPPLHYYFRKLKTLCSSAHPNSSLKSLGQLFGLEKVNGDEIHAATDGTFPLLRDLHFHGMRKLMDLGDNSFGPTKLYFPNVEILVLQDCDNLKSLKSSAISFNNLTTLKVSQCKGLEYFISFSVANRLRQLTTLEVKSCQRLVEIVRSNDDDDSRNEITFPRLKHLKLSILPRLQSFCSGNCTAKLPSLETATMSNRLKFKIFAADNQTLQLITNEGEDTDEEEPTAEDEMNSASTELISQ